MYPDTVLPIRILLTTHNLNTMLMCCRVTLVGMVPLRICVFISAVLLLRAVLFLQKDTGFKQPNFNKEKSAVQPYKFPAADTLENPDLVAYMMSALPNKYIVIVVWLCRSIFV